MNICKVVDGKYYGKDGKEVEYTTYKNDCLKICKVDNGKYFGMNGTEVTESQYRIECIPAVTVEVPSTGSNASAVSVVLGSLFVAFGLGSIKLSKKKNNM